MSTQTDNELDVGSVVDESPMTARRWALVALCFAVALLDGFDTQSIAYTGSAIADEFGLGTGTTAAIVTSGTIGMCLGAMTLGWLSDRFGRRPTIIGALVVFGAFSILASYAQTAEQIIALRFIIGLGMGGATPALLALTAEHSSRRRRGTFMTLVLLGLPGGALLGGVVAAAWLPTIGWRGIFLLGGVLPLGLAVVCCLLLVESPTWLAAQGDERSDARLRTLLATYFDHQAGLRARPVVRERDEPRGSLRALFEPRYRAVTVAVFGTYLLNWIAWYLFLLWMPTALVRLGLPEASAALGTVTVNGAFIVVAVPLSLLLPGLDPRRLLLVMFAVGIVTALGLGLAGDRFGWLFVLIAVAGFGIGGQQLALNYLIANAYPTQLRGTATGWGIGVGRLGSIVGSAVGGILLDGLGPSGYFAVLAVPLAAAAMATVLVSSRTPTGQPAGPER